MGPEEGFQLQSIEPVASSVSALAGLVKIIGSEELY